jgi:RNA polymerase sigma-70 factor, ECF subfamily
MTKCHLHHNRRGQLRYVRYAIERFYALHVTVRLEAMRASVREAELIPLAVAGDITALERLLHLHHVRLLSYIRRRFPQKLSGVLEPQDILQDTWLRAACGISKFEPADDSSFHVWLTTIARNLMSDHLRYRSASKRTGQQIALRDADSPDDIVPLLEELAVYHRTPSRSAISHELIASLENAISQLPKDQAEAIRLRYLERQSIKDVACAMERSEGSVLMLCNRALKSLQLLLKSASLHL